jgi:hypothetical protein
MAKPWCKNYQGMHEKTECEVGVKFADLEGHGTCGFFETCPCFGPSQLSVCSKAVYPTKEEMEATDREIAKRFENAMVAREAIVAACDGPWKRGDKGRSGKMDCPVCKGKHSLIFSRSGCNGHIHASCSTDGCVAWME